MIIRKDTKEVIMMLVLKATTVEQKCRYRLRNKKEERRQGYAEEVVNALIQWAFQLELLKKITARSYIDNYASALLLQN